MKHMHINILLDSTATGPEKSKHAVVALATLSRLSQSHMCPLHCSINFHNLALDLFEICAMGSQALLFMKIFDRMVESD